MNSKIYAYELDFVHKIRHSLMQKGDSVMHIFDLSSITIEDEDLVVILSNLLDNAIEACRRWQAVK